MKKDINLYTYSEYIVQCNYGTSDDPNWDDASYVFDDRKCTAFGDALDDMQNRMRLFPDKKFRIIHRIIVPEIIAENTEDGEINYPTV